MTRPLHLALCLAAALALGKPAVAASQTEWDACEKGSFKQREAGCTRIIDNAGESGWSRANAFGKRAFTYYKEGDLDRAIADYNEAIKLEPTAARFYFERGNAFGYKGDGTDDAAEKKRFYERALADFSEAVRLEPRVGVVHHNRGQHYRLLGDNDRAMADVNEAIRIDPGEASFYHTRGLIHRDGGDLDSAMIDFSEAIKRDRDLLNAYRDRSSGHFRKGNLESTVADLNETLRIDPNSAELYFLRGIATIYVGMLPQALGDIARASEMDPEDPFVALWLDTVIARLSLPSRLKGAVPAFDMTEWPAPVVRYYLGEIDETALLAAANAIPTDTREGGLCDAHFYGGTMLLRRGARADARQQFELAAKVCPVTSVEGLAANAELKALGASR